METVAGEKPLEFATSRMVTAADLPDGRFTVFSVPASSGRSVPLCNGCFIALLRGHFKRKGLAEPVRLPNPKGDSECHPHGSEDLCRHAQAPPQSQANEK